MSKYTEQCDNLGLVYNRGVHTPVGGGLFFADSMDGGRVHLRWYFRGIEHKTTMPMEMFLNLTKTDIDSMVMTHTASSEYVIDATAKVLDLKREIDTFNLGMDDEETVFEERLGVILSRSGK